MLLENGAQVTTDILCEESELLGAVRTDQTLVAEVLLTNGNCLSSCEWLCFQFIARIPNSLRINVFSVGNLYRFRSLGVWV